MHTYHDEPTGIRFHYNSDLSGDVSISVPAGKGTKTHHMVEIPADALSRFVCHAMFDSEEMIAGLDRIRDWLNRHTNVVSGPVPDMPVVWPDDRRCETCEDAPDDCYPNPPGSGGCEHYKPKVGVE